MRWYQHDYHTVFAHKLVFSTIPFVPKALHPPIAAVTALIFFLLLRDERRAMARNLCRICGRTGWRIWWKAYSVFYSFCDFIVSYCYVPRADDRGLRAMLTASNAATPVEHCLEQGNGLLVWTAHLGNWEFASRWLELHGRRVNVARVVERGNRAEMMLRELMTNPRLNVVQLNDNPLASVELLSALRNNEIVAMQGDRVYHPHYEELQFFGGRARFPTGPFLLAYISGAPLLPGFVVRKRWLRYQVIFGPPIVFRHDGERESEIRAAMEQAVRFLEQNVRAYPEQWLNFYDFWAAGEQPA